MAKERFLTRISLLFIGLIALYALTYNKEEKDALYFGLIIAAMCLYIEFVVLLQKLYDYIKRKRIKKHIK
jgi:hypothetical protein